MNLYSFKVGGIHMVMVYGLGRDPRGLHAGPGRTGGQCVRVLRALWGPAPSTKPLGMGLLTARRQLYYLLVTSVCIQTYTAYLVIGK